MKGVKEAEPVDQFFIFSQENSGTAKNYIHWKDASGESYHF
jgi:hypothetical protein